jgi:hypothetical protein
MLLDLLSLEVAVQSAPAIAPPPPITPFISGGPPYRDSPKRKVRVVAWRHDWEALQTLHALGEIDDEEYEALRADSRETVGVS